MRYSTVFSTTSAVALLGAMLTQAQERIRILNEERIASTLPLGKPTADIIMEHKDNVRGDFTWELFSAEDQPGRYTLVNVQGSHTASAYVQDSTSMQPIKVSVDPKDGTVWSIEPSAVDGQYIIKLPYENLLWTNLARGSDGNNAIYLRPADGSPQQSFALTQIFG